MLHSGIIRRVDELGRIVIPREMRNIMKIKDGDQLEICRDGDNVVLVKYTPTDDKQDAVDTLQEWLKDTELSANLTDVERATLKMLLDKISTINS